LVVKQNSGDQSLAWGVGSMNWMVFGLVGLSGLTTFWLCLSLSEARKSIERSRLRRLLERTMPEAVRRRYEMKLAQANLEVDRAFDVWMGRMALGFVTAGLCGWLLGGWVFIVLGFGAGWMAVGVWLEQRIKQHQALLTRQLPAFLDLLSMCLCAGLNLQTGVQLVLSFQPKTALGDLWRSWLLQVRSGASRTDAFKKLLARVSAPALRRVCVALIQAEQAGSSMANSLSVHSQQVRKEQLLAAEKQALEAPVKMLLPLVVCFFPSTFLVLGFSIYVNVGAMFD
jgi:tight adherence protein C